jgi:DNA-binding transcriptional LysR family regulator
MGEIHLGFSSSIIYSDVPQRISAFSKEMPEIGLHYRVQGGDELKSLLDWGEVDAMVNTLPFTSDEYLCVAVSKQAMGIAVHASHRLAGRKTLTLEALRDDPFIVVPRERHPRNHDALISRFRDIGASLQISAYETSFPNVLARVAMGQGVAHVALGYQGERSDGVRVLHLDDPLLSETPIYVVARRDNLQKPTQRLIDFLTGSGAKPGPKARRHK